MTEPEPRFPDYGDDGDLAGAHRNRRSFRFVVVSIFLLTVSAFFAEKELRYSLPENHFLSAITLPRESARVFLLSAIKQDEEASDTPTPKYTQALAVRQEDDIAPETYARAYEMDPKNSMFAIRYGCRLFLLDRPAEALEIFRAAKSLPPTNSLPRYLEAASIAKGVREPEGLGEAMVIVSRANNTRDPIIYPKPLWFSAYPHTGKQYAQLSREVYAEACAPLYALTQQIAATHRQQSSRGVRDEKTWLHQVESMGRRLVRDSDPRGSLQAIAGVSIQLQALQALESLLAGEGDDAAADERETVHARIATLKSALDVLNEFEADREEAIAAVTRKYSMPLVLVFATLPILIAVYLIARVVLAILRSRRSAWTLPHSPLGKGILALGVIALFLTLGAVALFQHLPGGQEWYMASARSVWWTVVAILVGFGLLYPAIRVPSPEEVTGKSGRLEDMPDLIRYARAAHRRAYAAMSVRFFGILAGGYVCMACTWILLYRIANGLYPWQINLLASGLGAQETEVVQQALRILGPN